MPLPAEGSSAPGGAWIANARMYAVTPQVEAAWRELLAAIARDAQVPLTYVPYPAPQPLELLWARPDLGAAFMCGYPIALGLAPVVPLAAPIPAADWAGGRAVYRTDLIVRADAPYRSLEDTFGGVAGWTVAHSQSGFNAFRHELLAHRRPDGAALYARVQGNLVTARNVLDGVRAGSLDVGPLDAYWHLLIARHAPELTAGIRVLKSTPTTPMPCFVAAAGAPADMVERLRDAFGAAAGRSWFEALAAPLLIEGFAPASVASYGVLLEWDREARAAGYAEPA
ncbi:MAG TPA: PhnD/SsuA/transferrin family substrate-binding protein [Steroidobacteraceae bacterium]|nr:PhnD/SsuA/transferrin family substrate-binding protein [Steroidobacteraceae bacterium]